MTILQSSALSSALDPDQQVVARQVTGPLAILAGVGMGRTRAITYHIAYRNTIDACPSDSMLIVTLACHAAREMRRHLVQLDAPRVQVRTFYSMAPQQLQRFWPTVTSGSLSQVVPYRASLVSSAVARPGVVADKAMVCDLVAGVEWVKVSMVNSEHYLEHMRSGHESSISMSGNDMTQFLEVYGDAKAERGVIDFEDVLAMTCAMLQEQTDVAAKVCSQYRCLVVNESQGVFPPQRRLLDLWLGDHHDARVVDDVAQTTYSFAGADPRYLVDFPKTHKSARVLELTCSYRSTSQIVSIVNRLMAGAGPSSGAVHLKSQYSSGAATSFLTYMNERAETEGVADKIEALITAGIQLRLIVALLRMNG